MKNVLNVKTLFTWAIVGVIIYFSMWNEFWLMLLGALSIVIVVFQLHTIIQLLQEQNELLRQKNEKQE